MWYSQGVNGSRLTVASWLSAGMAIRFRSVALATTVLAAGGCNFFDQLLEINAPSVVDAGDIAKPSNADLLVRSAIGDFECALGSYTVGTGLVGNYLTGTTQGSRRYEVRDLSPRIDYTGVVLAGCDRGLGVTMPLSTARWQADNTLALLDGWSDGEVPNRVRLIATVAAFSGYSHLLIGESQCTAAFDFGPELTRPQIFERAKARFDRAITGAQQAGAADVLNLARLGRARTKLNLDDLPGARQDAEAVTPGFRWNANYSTATPRRENQIYYTNYIAQSVSIKPEYRNLTWKGVKDPRVGAVDAKKIAEDRYTTIWFQTKYTRANSPIPIARSAEAQLIIAEGALKAGERQTAVGIINALHRAVGLPEFSSSDSKEILDQIVYERQAELYLESQHLGDINRYKIPLVPPPGTPNPVTGGGFYGNQTCFPMHDIERLNNPTLRNK